MPDLTNLLPIERQRAFSREYRLRLSVTALILISLLASVSALFLLPTYVFLTKSAVTKSARLANIESVLSSADERTLSAHLTALANNAKLLISLGRAPSPSEIVREALAVSRPGIKISGFAYEPAATKKPGTLAVSGVAATRDALRSYQLALQSATFATAAALPVSAFAKDAEIPFTIIVTLASPEAKTMP